MRLVIALTLLAAFSPSQWVGAAEPGLPACKVINMDYTAWSNFPKGTAIVVKTVGSGSGVAYKTLKEWKITETTTLLEASPDKIELEIETTRQEDGGKDVKLPPRKVKHARLIDAPSGGRPAGKAEGLTETEEKTITVGGKPFKVKGTRVEEANFDAEGSTHVIVTWQSDEVPGRLIRRIGEMTGTYWYKESVELLKITKPVK